MLKAGIFESGLDPAETGLKRCLGRVTSGQSRLEKRRGGKRVGARE